MVESKGLLNPGAADVSIDRFTIGLDDLVRHVWVVRWDVPAGQVRRQRVLTYPACNIVVSPDGAALYGPDPSVSVRELSGRSWVVGVLMRPAAARALTFTDPGRLVAASEPMPDAPVTAIRAAMHDGRPVGELLHDWLEPVSRQVDASGRLVNTVCRLAEDRDDVIKVEDLARLVATTPRNLGRIVKYHTGLTPKWLIECRRLQQAAMTLYTRPDTDLATLAVGLGYADQAHFTRRYHQVLDETPDRTRRVGRSHGTD